MAAPKVVSPPAMSALTSTLTLRAPATPVLAESRPVSIMALSKAGER